MNTTTANPAPGLPKHLGGYRLLVHHRARKQPVVDATMHCLVATHAAEVADIALARLVGGCKSTA